MLTPPLRVLFRSQWPTHSRSCFSRLLLVAALLILTDSLPAWGRNAEPRKRPNIVFILADDLGLGHVGAFGQTLIRTPAMDRIAAEGMRFERCYAGANVCAPSRSTLMTGLHTGHTAVRANGGGRHLSDADVTVAEVLKQAGYATGGFGKWGLGLETNSGFPLRQGFDEWFGQYNQMHAHFFYPYYLWHGNKRHLLSGNEQGGRRQYAHDEIHAQGLDFIRRHQHEPFFCYLPYILPHVELTVPADSRREYEGKFPKKAIADPRPGYLGSDDAYAEFAGMVGRLDRSVGEVLALLKELKLDEQTIVFFCSDNGPQPGVWTEVFVDYFDGNGPYRGAKGDFYEGGIRTPLMVRWPKQIAAGSQTKHLCAFYDVLPTLAELAGATIPAGLDGLSFAPTLLGRGSQQLHEFLYWEHPFTKGDTHAVRLGKWKAVQGKPGGKLELYDLEADPAETTDLANQQPEVMARIEAIIAREHTPERKFTGGESYQVKDFVR